MITYNVDAARQKLDRLKRGERCVTNDIELDAILEHCTDDPARYEIRSIPNPQRCGVLDQYIAWISDE